MFPLFFFEISANEYYSGFIFSENQVKFWQTTGHVQKYIKMPISSRWIVNELDYNDATPVQSINTQQNERELKEY